MSRHYALRSGHIAVAKMIAAMVSEPQTMHDLVEVSGLNETTVRGYLRNLKREKAIYIAAWEEDASRKWSLRAYMIGRRPDARKPTPMRKDRALLALKSRMRRQQKAMIQMTAGALA